MNSNIIDAMSLLDLDFKIVTPDDYPSQLNRYRQLLESWNDFAGLMGPRELQDRFDEHVVDSLSLAPYINKMLEQGHAYTDLGSGGGFPAIPVKLLLPRTNLTLIERSERKSAFLLKVISALSLESTKVLTGSFPEASPHIEKVVFTARAIERPEEVFRALTPFIMRGCSFLSQNATHLRIFEDTCQIREIEDSFSKKNIRRGNLYLVTATDD